MQKIIWLFVTWMNKKYPFIMREVVVGHDKHIHSNPRKRLTAVVNFPKEDTDGK